MKCAPSAVRVFVAECAERAFADSGREYSIERVFAFREYCERTSPVRVLLVLVFNLSLPLLVLTALDVVPLQSPDANWQDNTSFWMRTFVNAIVVCGGIMVQAPLVIPDVALTRKRMGIIVAGVAVCYTGSLMLLARLWVFSVPFTFTMGGIPFCTAMAVFATLTLGRHDRAQLWTFVRFTNNIAVQTSMMLVYPSYNAIFLRLRGPLQPVFVLLLPVIKHSFKYAIAKVQAADADLIPAMLSSVDIFDALYMTKCMQSAGSIEVGLGIIAIDIGQNLIAMYSITRQTRTLRALYARNGDPNQWNEVHAVASDRDDNEQSASSLFRILLDSLKRLDVNPLRSSASHRLTLSAQAQVQLTRLHASNQVVPLTESQSDCIHETMATKSSSSVITKKKTKKLASATVAVAPIGSLKPAWVVSSKPELRAIEPPEHGLPHDNEDSKDDETDRTQRLVRESVRLLHETEAVGVIEYIETVVPVFYALYITLLFSLPNAQYYEDMRNFSAEKLRTVVANILVYAAMELASLMWVHRMLQRSFGISLVYQLAFTMEREWRLFQCNFISWILVVFQFLLLHNGSDYSFEFKWISGGSRFDIRDGAPRSHDGH